MRIIWESVISEQRMELIGKFKKKKAQNGLGQWFLNLGDKTIKHLYSES